MGRDQDTLPILDSHAELLAQRGWRLAYALLNNAQDAEDAVQRAFVVAAQKPEAIPVDNPWPWFSGVVTRIVFNMRRASTRRHSVTIDGELIANLASRDGDGSAGAEKNEIVAAIRELLLALPPEEGEALLLIYMGELSIRQAAKSVGVPRQTLANRASRGLKTLRQRLGISSAAAGRLLGSIPVVAMPRGLLVRVGSGSASTPSRSAISHLFEALLMKNSVAVICAVALPALLILGSVGVYFGSDNPSFDIATRTEQQTAGVADTGNGVVSGRNAGSNSEATGATSNAQGSARPHGQGSVKSVAADDEGSAKVTLDSGESPDEPKPDPDLTEAQNYVVFQLSKTPSAVFKDLRSNYDRQPGEWTTKGKGNLDAIDTLLAFAPKDTKWQTWEVERFLSFVCYLADRGEVKASGFLWTVNAQFEGNEPQPLMEILKARSGSFESCFAENKVVGIVTMAPFSIKLEVGGRD